MNSSSVSTFSYLIQGLLFSAMSTTLLVFLFESFSVYFNIFKEIIPRLLFFHACLSFVIGTTILDSLTVRYDRKYGIIIGPIGSFLVNLVVMYVLAFVVVTTNEYIFAVPAVLLVAYSFSQARAINHMYSGMWNSFVVFILILALVGLVVDVDAIDETLETMFKYYDITDNVTSQLNRTYLVKEGGMFHHSEAVVVLYSTVCAFLIFSAPKFDLAGV